jgi:hypothetical protein
MTEAGKLVYITEVDVILARITDACEWYNLGLHTQEELMSILREAHAELAVISHACS